MKACREKAGLEEARQSDLLLHVCDASNSMVLDQISAVFEVLEELGIDEKDTLLVINKIDCADEATIESVLRRYPNGITVSARTGDGIDRLAAGVSDALSRTFREVDVRTNVANGRLMAYLAAKGEVISQSYEGDEVTLHCRIPQKYLGRIRDPECWIFEHGTEEVVWSPDEPQLEPWELPESH